jgi:hypothetical protein
MALLMDQDQAYSRAGIQFFAALFTRQVSDSSEQEPLSSTHECCKRKNNQPATPCHPRASSSHQICVIALKELHR